MGCNQSISSHDSDSDSDTDSSSDDIPFEKVPFNPPISNVPSRSSITTSRHSSNLNNIGNNRRFEHLHKINVTTNGTLSPISNNEDLDAGFPIPTPLPSVQDDISNISTTSLSNPTNKKISIEQMLTPTPETPTNTTYTPSGLRYRTKKVSIYKPKLQTKTQLIAPNKPSNKHTRQTSKDDMDITLRFSTNRKAHRTKNSIIDPRANPNRLSVSKRESIFNSYNMSYDLGCVTDIEEDSEDDDNITVVRHDSSANYDSDDSFWDAQYIANRSKNSSVSHRRKATYHAYGGDDAANKTDSESGIGEYDEDELSDASLNQSRIATGFNEDHRMTQGIEQEDDDTDIETAHYDHLHQNTGTTTHSNDEQKVPPITKQSSNASDETCSVNSSASFASSVDKSSISIQQIDKAAFLQKILRNSINKHKVLKDEERGKKEKELKLQETHRTSNIKVIDDNTIAINIGMSRVCDDPPLPEGNEDEHYENQSDDSEDTDTDPETAMLDFGVMEEMNTSMNALSDDTSDENNSMDLDPENMKMFRVMHEGVSVYQDIALKDEIFSVRFKEGEEVQGEYRDECNVVLLYRMKLYVSSSCVMDVTDDPKPQDMDQLMKDEKEAMDKLKQILQKINASNAESHALSSEKKPDVHNVPQTIAKVSIESETSTESISSPSEQVVMEPIHKDMKPPPIVIGDEPKPIKTAQKTTKKKTNTMKRVSIRKGKRKKKRKRKKIISATPPVERASPRFFSNKDIQKQKSEKELKVDRPDTPTRPESPIIAKYKHQLVENKDEILKMLQEHKQKKKARQKRSARSRAQTAEKVQKKVYVSKTNRDTSWMRSDTEPRIYDVPSPVQTNTDASRMSFKQRMQMYQENTCSMSPRARQKVNEIKAARKRTDSDASMSEQQRQKASHLLQNYANKKAKHCADVTLIAEVLKNSTKENCVQNLMELGIVSYIYVHINQFERWSGRNNLSNLMDVGGDNKEEYMKHPKEYVKMANITLLNSKILIKLAEEQKESFKRLVLLGIEQCRLIYKMNFTAANITNAFLDKILKAIAMRNEIIQKQKNVQMNGERMYGPELLLIENNPISDRGIGMICKHIERNDGVHLKCLKMGHCFGTISTGLCALFCESLQSNKYILKVTFDMRWKQHRNAVDKSLKQNYTRYRALQKEYKKTLKMKRN